MIKKEFQEFSAPVELINSIWTGRNLAKKNYGTES